MIGGLLSSTLLTLVLVPTLYTMVERTKESLRQRRARRTGRSAAAGSAPAGVPAADGAFGGDQRAEAGVATAERTVAAPPVRPSAALVDGTDQFEVLRLPKTRRSPLPPTE